MATLRPDDFRPGLYVTITDYDEAKVWQDEDVYGNVRDLTPPPGIPLHIKAVHLPFIAVELPPCECRCGKRHGPVTLPLDTRTVTLSKVSPRYAQAFGNDSEFQQENLEELVNFYEGAIREIARVCGVAGDLNPDEMIKQILNRASKVEKSQRNV